MNIIKSLGRCAYNDTFLVNLEGSIAVAKYQKPSSITRSTLHTCVANVLGDQGVYNSCKKRQEREKNMLKALASTHFPAPRLLENDDQSSDYLLMTFIEGSNPCQFSSIKRKEVVSNTFKNLARLHDLGLYHGDPLLRNIISTEEESTFIDWEIEVGGDLSYKQERDLAILFQSSVKHMGDKQGIESLCNNSYGKLPEIRVPSMLLWGMPSYFKTKFKEGNEHGNLRTT